MKVGIYGQFYHEDSNQYIQELLDVLFENNIEVVIEENFLEMIHRNKTSCATYGHFKTFEELDSTYELFFSIGGDGTILKTVTFIRDLNIPIVGINTGRLGFLATIQKSGIKEAVSDILEKKYSITRRSLLQVESISKKKENAEINIALNEITISRKNTTSMLTTEIWLNGEYLNAYWADGLIVSTPTGSTGYSLSCGGPIISPLTKALVITPIAPHNLNARPLVIPDDTSLEIKVSGREDHFLLSLDARTTTYPTEVLLKVEKAPYKINLVVLKNNSFIKTLRKKLLWGEDKRNRKQ